MIKKLIQKYWHYVVLIILAVLFFIGASSYIYSSQKGGFIKWGSPDETANYIFTKLYTQESRLEIFEKYNLPADDVMSPRSMRSDGGEIKPVSFLGIILIYGFIAKIFSYKIIPYLTPFFASIGIIYFYFLLKRIFGASTAIFSALILVVFPPFFYYSARSIFHNVLFVVFLIIGLYYTVVMSEKKDKNGQTAFKTVKPFELLYASLAGFFIGLALITRTSEILWVMPMLLILWLFNIKKIGITKILLFLFFIFLTFTPIFYWNNILYGSPFNSGYAAMNNSIKNLAHESFKLLSGSLAYFKIFSIKLKDNVFYFGFWPKLSFKMFYEYFVKMFAFLFWPAAAGFFLLISKAGKLKKKHWAYFSAYSLVSLFLIFYYGSWEFHDNPDFSRHTIGNSYTRYWLPVYLGAMPLAGFFIIKLSKIFKKKIFIISSQAIIIILIFFISLKFVWTGSEEGLKFSLEKGRGAREEFNKVISLTPNNSVIITYYHDKLFFPERKVIVGFFDDKNMVSQYARLVNYLPVYYYNFTLPEKDIEYLNTKRLKEFGLSIEEIEKINNDFTLYRLKKAVESL